uniref:Putative secreted protein n=1 Tax=Ixodes scapularis TaxID=6945 RepID=A0A4D5S1C4_IXOSC
MVHKTILVLLYFFFKSTLPSSWVDACPPARVYDVFQETSRTIHFRMELSMILEFFLCKIIASAFLF